MIVSHLQQSGGIAHSEFSHNIFAMHTDGLVAYKQLFGYFFVAQRLGDQLEDLYFPFGKVVFFDESVFKE